MVTKTSYKGYKLFLCIIKKSVILLFIFMTAVLPKGLIVSMMVYYLANTD